MHEGIDGRVIGLLEQGHAVDAGPDQFPVLLFGQRIDLHAGAGEIAAQNGRAVGQVGDRAVGLGLAGKYEDVLQAGGGDGLGFGLDLVQGQRLPGQGGGGVESAVAATVDAVVGEIQRGKSWTVRPKCRVVSSWARWAMATGSLAVAMAVLTSTAAAPISMASQASEGRPRPASTMIGSAISSMRIRTNSRVRRPRLEPMGAPRGMTAAAPAAANRLAASRSGLI